MYLYKIKDGEINSENGLCIVHHEKKIAFINIPKNASTSIRVKLFSQGFKWDNIRNLSSDYFVFTVIREPYKRFVSSYNEMLKRATGDCKKYGATEKSFYSIRNPIDRFKMFVQKEIRNHNLFEIHLQQQMWFLTDENNEMFPINKIIKFENLQEELSIISKQLNINLDIDAKNSGKNNEFYDVMMYYNDLKNLVKEAYMPDFILYDSVLNSIPKSNPKPLSNEMTKISGFGDHTIYSYNTDDHPFQQYFVNLYKTDQLDEIHEKSKEYSKFQKGELGPLENIETDLHKIFYKDIKENNQFKTLYCDFIKKIYKQFFPDEKVIIYQSFPSVRIQYMDNVVVPPHKDSDSIGQHPIGEKNFLLPITKMFGTNTLYVESEPDKEDFRPVELDYGQLFFFNGNMCTHYNVPNKENKVRISLDFRVILEKDYMKYINTGNLTTTNPRDSEKSRKPTKMIAGGYYQICKIDKTEKMQNWVNVSKNGIMQSRPVFEDEEISAVVQYMKSEPFLTEYNKTEQLEKIFSDYIGCKHTVMTTSGTTAIMLALYCLGIQPGDDVLVPNYTMIATANSVKAVGARPILIDVERSTGTISLNTIKKYITPKTKAIIHVTLNNRSFELEKIIDFCKKEGLYLIEDAAQSLGCYLGNKHYGTFGDIGCFSLSTPKIISTGQGGFCVTNNDSYAKSMRRIKNFGRSEGGSDIYEEFGINLKITDIQAVIGIEQMKKLEVRRKRLREIHDLYYNQLNKFMIKPKENWIPWFIDIYVDDRESLQRFLKHHNIQSRFTYPSLDTTIYDKGNFENSYYFSNKGLFLPTHFKLTDDEIYYICQIINLYCSNYNSSVN
jgi:perosamine synthetase